MCGQEKVTFKKLPVFDWFLIRYAGNLADLKPVAWDVSCVVLFKKRLKSQKLLDVLGRSE
jgi:hypothetical protein